MIRVVGIKNFKAIKDDVFVLRPLTILTGTNSVGKSTMIQMILLHTKGKLGPFDENELTTAAGLELSNFLQDFKDCVSDDTQIAFISTDDGETALIAISPKFTKNYREFFDRYADGLILVGDYFPNRVKGYLDPNSGKVVSYYQLRLNGAKNAKKVYYTDDEMAENKEEMKEIKFKHGIYEIGFFPDKFELTDEYTISEIKNLNLNGPFRGDPGLHYEYEEDLYYISANRIGPEEFAENDNNIKFGVDGRYAFSYFHKHKDDDCNFIKDKDDTTIFGQLKYWTKYILEIDLELQTKQLKSKHTDISFKISEEKAVSAFNIGAGCSYLMRILIMALSMKKGDIFIIENPEIHLHPKAVSKLMEFFTFIVNQGVQLIIETHSEYLIHKLRYQIYKENFSEDDARIFYKDNTMDKFTRIDINKNGKFIDKDGEICEFPTGFMDVDLDEMLEIM